MINVDYVGLVGPDQPWMGAVFSPCGRFRYSLWRRWSGSPGYCMFIGLNPSTADAMLDDPTMRRCINFSKAWGFPAFVMTNLFAWRDTDPEQMKKAAAPIGPDNDQALLALAGKADFIVAAWGRPGRFMQREHQVLKLLDSRSIHCLGLNEDGTPKHPLYLKATTSPVHWSR